MKELFMGTEKGDEILSGFIEKSKRNDAYRKFKNRVNARNMDRAVIADSYFTASELNGYNIDGEDGADVIEEDSAEGVKWKGNDYTFNRDGVKSICFFILKDGTFIKGSRDYDETHSEVMLRYCYKLIDEECPIRDFDGKIDYYKAENYICERHKWMYDTLCNSIDIQGRIFITNEGEYVFACYQPLDDDDAKRMMAKASFMLDIPKDKCYYIGHYNTKVVPLIENNG